MIRETATGREYKMMSTYIHDTLEYLHPRMTTVIGAVFATTCLVYSFLVVVCFTVQPGNDTTSAPQRTLVKLMSCLHQRPVMVTVVLITTLAAAFVGVVSGSARMLQVSTLYRKPLFRCSFLPLQSVTLNRCSQVHLL